LRVSIERSLVLGHRSFVVAHDLGPAASFERLVRGGTTPGDYGKSSKNDT
jgi:hypothetical protein